MLGLTSVQTVINEISCPQTQLTRRHERNVCLVIWLYLKPPPPARRQHIMSCFCIEGTGKVWFTSAKHLAPWAKRKPSLLHWVSANIKYDVKSLGISFPSLGTLQCTTIIFRMKTNFIKASGRHGHYPPSFVSSHDEFLSDSCPLASSLCLGMFSSSS